MPKKEDWKTQADVDAIANRLLREVGGDLDRVHGNAVATALGMPKGNQSIYAKVDDWKRPWKRRAYDTFGKRPTAFVRNSTSAR